MRVLLILLLFNCNTTFSQTDSLEIKKEVKNLKWCLKVNVNYWINFYDWFSGPGVELDFERRVYKQSKLEMYTGFGYSSSFYLRSLTFNFTTNFLLKEKSNGFLKLSYPVLQNRLFAYDEVDITNMLFKSSIGINYNFKKSFLTAGIGGWAVERTDFEHPYDSGPERLSFLPIVEIGYAWRF